MAKIKENQKKPLTLNTIVDRVKRAFDNEKPEGLIDT